MRTATELSQRALALHPAARVGLVHDVVVVERGQVGQLHHHRGGHDPGRVRVAELGAEHHQQWPEALTAGLQQMPGGVRDEGDVALGGLQQALLHRREYRPWMSASRAASHTLSPKGGPTTFTVTRGAPVADLASGGVHGGHMASRAAPRALTCAAARPAYTGSVAGRLWITAGASPYARPYGGTTERIGQGAPGAPGGSRTGRRRRGAVARRTRVRDVHDRHAISSPRRMHPDYDILDSASRQHHVTCPRFGVCLQREKNPDRVDHGYRHDR